MHIVCLARVVCVTGQVFCEVYTKDGRQAIFMDTQKDYVHRSHCHLQELLVANCPIGNSYGPLSAHVDLLLSNSGEDLDPVSPHLGSRSFQ